MIMHRYVIYVLTECKNRLYVEFNPGLGFIWFINNYNIASQFMTYVEAESAMLDLLRRFSGFGF